MSGEMIEWTFEGYWNAVLGLGSATDVVREYDLQTERPEARRELDEWLGRAEEAAWSAGNLAGDLREAWGVFHEEALSKLSAAAVRPMRIRVFHSSDWGCDHTEEDSERFNLALAKAVSEHYDGVETVAEEQDRAGVRVHVEGASFNKECEIENAVMEIHQTVWDAGEFWGE